MFSKEDYLKAMAHQIPESVPLYGKPVRYNVGLNEPFERGPAGGGKDGFGVVWEPTDDGGAVPSTASFVLTDVTKWREQVTFPDLDLYDWAAKAEKDLAGADREKQVVEYCMANGPFERFMALTGYENLIYSFYDEPEACHEYLDAYVDYKIKHIKIAAKYYNPEFIAIFDDVAYEKGPFLTLDTYREFIKPCHIRLNNAIRECGIQPINHCCGRAEALVEDFIEEGAVAWTSVQPSNDIAGMLRKYHDRYTFIGGFDSQGAPASLTATEEERRAEARRVIDTYAPYGSFLFYGHLLSGPTPEKTREYIMQVTDEVAKYGKDFYKRNRNR